MSDKPSPPLVKDDRVVGTHVYVGTNVWFEHWLADQKLESFRYECPEGSFTARQRKGGYWNAYRKVKGKLRQEYLGKATDLTQAKLIETARTLAMDNTEYWRMKYPRPDQVPQPSQESTGLYNQSVDCITEIELKEITNAVRQWCVFARHNDGKLQFMGGYWSKGDAGARMHKARRDHHLSESIGDKAYIGPPPTYEVREMLVAPVGLYNHSTDCITEARNKEEVQRLQAEAEARIEALQARIEVLTKDQAQHQVTKLKLNQAESRAEELQELVTEYQTKLEAIAQPEPPTSSPDPAAILNRLRKERRKSKADMKDVELIIELLGAIAL
jgi:hypothetical protein